MIRETHTRSVSAELSGVCTMAWIPLLCFLLHCTGQESHLHSDDSWGKTIETRNILSSSLIPGGNVFLYFQGLSPNLCWLSHLQPQPPWEPQSNSPAPWVVSTAATELNGTSNNQTRLLSIWCFSITVETMIGEMGYLIGSLAPALALIAT